MFGSSIRSPLLHACSSVHEAYKWNSRAANSEKRRKDLGLMCRVDLEIVGEENVIDLSTDAAQHRFFTKGPQGYGEWCRLNWH